MVARSGAVTILCTDLVNSTELLERAGDEDARRVWQAHQKLRLVLAPHPREDHRAESSPVYQAFDIPYLSPGCAVAADAGYSEAKLEKYAARISERFGTLQSYRTVAARFEKSTRVENLTWSHHREVASLDDAERWLKRAAREKR